MRSLTAANFKQTTDYLRITGKISTCTFNTDWTKTGPNPTILFKN